MCSSDLVRWRGVWIERTPGMLLTSPEQVVDHVNANRSKSTGKVDKRKITKNTVKVTTDAIAKKAIRKKIRHAGLTKGAWLVAGKKALGMARAKVGISVKTSTWPGNVAAKVPGVGSASVYGGDFHPIVELTNHVAMSRMERFLKSADIKSAIYKSYRATIRQYKRAVESIRTRA